MTSDIGFIGLGTMGRPMARNLLAAGYGLVFFARRDEVAEPFLEQGAQRASTPAEVARRADIVISIVTADDQLLEVALGPAGIVEGAASGKLLIDMSTVSPSTARLVAATLAERKMGFLDAPVSGGPWGAQQGTLTIMVGGSGDDLARARPVLEVLGRQIAHVGPVGAGQSLKLVNNMIGGGIMALVGEGLALARAAGIDLDQAIDVLMASSAASSLLEARGKSFILADRYEPGFKTALMRKDVALAVDLARTLEVPVPLAAAALQQYTAAVRQGCGEQDFASVARYCGQAAGQNLARP